MTELQNQRRFATDEGFILPTALIALFLVTILAGTAVTVAVKSSTSTTRDSNVKSALAAAEAGLQIATYRINTLQPSVTQCVTKNATKEVKESETCESNREESLGNGASFHYLTTRELTKGECAGAPVEKKSNIVKRCVTAEGIVNGVSPHTRVQALIESAIAPALFEVHGILGLEEVLVSGSVKATAVVASNDKITSVAVKGGKASGWFEKGFELCPGGKFEPAAGTERTKSGVTVGPKDEKENLALEITRSSGCPLEAKLQIPHPNAAENEDSRIGTSDAVYENTKGAVEFNPSNHELLITSSGKLTLGGSKYYFCNVKLEKSGVLAIATGAQVEIFIGDQAEGCPAGSGTFKIENAAKIENPNSAGDLLIQMAGKGPLAVTDGANLKANINAPEAEVLVSGAGTLTGAIVGNKVHLEGGAFVFAEEDSTLTTTGSSGGSYERKAWAQCKSGSGVASEC